MLRPNAIQLGGLILLIIAVFGGASLLPDHFAITLHEGDALHLADIVLRLAEGQVPHVDVMTPIGGLAFWPIAWLVQAGFGLGQAFLWSQVIVALVLAPAIWWVAVTRLPRGAALLFVASVLFLLLALVHGGTDQAISPSMHYNRWGWALTFIVVVASVIAPLDRGTATVDGLVIGLSMAALALIKVTYFGAFSIPVIIALLRTGQRRVLWIALATGLAVALLVTVLLGPGYWAAYIEDLRTVAASEIRPQPGLPIEGVLTAPLYLGASFALIASVVFLRQAGAEAEGLVLLLLAPGFVYVAFQNFGNDPQWLMLLAVLLLAYLPKATEGRNMVGLTHRAALGGTAAVALALAAPNIANLAFSPIKHLAADTEEDLPLIPGAGRHEDILISSVRSRRTDLVVPLDAPELGLPALRDEEQREDPIGFLGETRAHCALENGLVAVLEAVVRDLEEAGYEGTRIFGADLLSPLWLYGDLEPVPGAAPWYYGRLSGFDASEFLLILTCPLTPRVQSIILSEIMERDTEELTEVRRTALYTLYRIGEGEEAPVPPAPGDAAENSAEADVPRGADEDG
ncbi:glycosyltransferase family 87 protein [Histidinibacterium aquaticum]|uniref:DUF2029 domain-containing protein n=1 Tax=Histidinibacterium aquaticum TaxID=2613962 RepID=A0A5J5GC20_9RHOB|nr:glycosyltransferase family 87 protein [Histidinibacterium aquaticum]KAA9005719.1 DUF2029 domain-containing protein [Histidinibacterium aquaticum]